MSEATPASASRGTVLIVDDSRSNLAFLSHLLSPHYDVLTADSGEIALQLAAGAQKPDLILLDVIMPGRNGYDVLGDLRENRATRDIPIIFVTGLDATEEEEKGLGLGAVDYIAKPFRPPIILARVRTHIDLKHARDQLANQNVHLEAELTKRLQENQQVQIQLLQSEKLAAIGQLAAGIVHEINSPVGFVTSNLATLDAYRKDIFELLDAYAVLEESCAPAAPALSKIRVLKKQKEIDFLRDDISKSIAESRDGLCRVAGIVRDLKNFSRGERNDWQWSDLSSGLESTLNIIGNEIKYHCTLRKDYGDIPKVYCNPSQINQVLLNLLVNAAQAIPEQGEIAIRSGQVDGKVFIAISDTGAGILAENLPRLFEPFFTTKPVGKGTGLGLSIAYGIVQKHKGHIEVESEVGKGTTFTMWLPVGSPDEAAASVES